MAKHVAVYARVSKGEQRLENQTPDLQRWLDVYAADEEVRWYTDKLSGRSTRRDGWRSLTKAIRRGEVKTLVVWKLDRLGRKLFACVQLFQILQELEVTLVSVMEGFDLSSPTGRLFANFLAALAEYESDLISQRIKAGQNRSLLEGGRHGGGRETGKFYLPDNAVENTIALHLDGVAPSRIAKALKISRTTVYKILRVHGVKFEQPAELKAHQERMKASGEMENRDYGRNKKRLA